MHGEMPDPWFKYRYAENTGAAFGFMRNVEDDVRAMLFLILTIIALIVILTIAWRICENKENKPVWAVNIALAGILAGAVGNFINRMQYEYVIDFIDMHLGFMHWPTYNVADIGISCGVILLILDMLFNKDSALSGKPDETKDEAQGKSGASDSPLKDEEKSAVSIGS
jgi:signal peptidase II